MVATIESVKSVLFFIDLNILPEEIEMLSDRVYTPVSTATISIDSYKCCPTRHGCSGATNCDNAYGDYHR